MFWAAASFFLTYVLVSAFLGLLLLLQLFPYRPTTTAGWTLLFTLVLPVTLIGEAIGSWLFSNRVAKSIDGMTKARSFSWLRIAYGVSTYLTLLAIGAAAYFLWKRLAA